MKTIDGEWAKIERDAGIGRHHHGGCHLVEDICPTYTSPTIVVATTNHTRLINCKSITIKIIVPTYHNVT